MKLLREYVELCLNEEAVTPAEAAKEKLALYVTTGTYGTVYVLYDAPGFAKYISNNSRSSSDMPEHIITWKMEDDIANEFVYGVIMIEPPSMRHGGRAWNAQEVNATAAREGYGPMMYDIAMSMEGGLVPDRDSVSSTAKRVWKFYKDNRSDVTAKPLDNVNDPKTPPTIDDAELHMGGKKNPLNYAYFMKKKPRTARLIANHKAAVSSLPRGKNRWLDILLRSAENFFSNKYRG